MIELLVGIPVVKEEVIEALSLIVLTAGIDLHVEWFNQG